MSVLTLPAPAAVPAVGPPVPKRWTVAEFHQLWEEGWFEGAKPMLLDGEIYLMPIPGPLHSTGVTLADYAIKAVFEKGFVVRVQMPLVLGQWTDPVPDIAVLTGSVRDYAATQPTTAELVVEVADTSLATDTGEKADLYAAAGIADYWVVDLNNRVLIVHRDPRPDPARQSGSSYGTVRTLTPGQTVSPLAAPQATVGVGDLLP
jgi:Uma2 family endonuclease